MYRLFSMQADGRLYQLGSRGWVRENGTNFPNVSDVRDFLLGGFVPDVGNPLDSYIAAVDAAGLILWTFPILEGVVR